MKNDVLIYLERKNKRSRLIVLSLKYSSFIIGLILIVTSIFLWKAVESNSLSQLSKNTESTAKIYVNKIESRFESIEKALGEIAGNSAPALTEYGSDWDMQVDFYINNIVGIESIAWVDNDMIIRRVLPLENNEHVINQNFKIFVLNKYHFIQWAPIYDDEIIEGFLLSNISIPELALSVSSDLKEDYMIQIFNESSLIFTSENWVLPKGELTAKGEFDLNSIDSYEFILAPTKQLVASSTRISYQILIYGLLLSIGAFISVMFAQRFNKKSKLLTQSQESLMTKQAQLEEQNLLMEEQLRDQQKLESIGTLASGVAHEINNPINGIMNYSQLILDDSERNSDTAEYAQEIIIETERVSTLIRNLLQFSRKGKQDYSYARPEDIISRAASLMDTVFKKDQIDLQLDIPEGLPNISCRSQQIQQVIMNLMINARDALNEKYLEYNANKIIKLNCATIQKEQKQSLRITIEDHGNGIPELIQEKMFDQFFTTKDIEKGTGLGLTISMRIIKEHHGELTFETKEGSFTRFYVDLPVDND